MPTGTCSYPCATPSGPQARLHSDAGAAPKLTGEIDLANARDVVEHLRHYFTGARRTIRVDLSQVTFMDCSGISACLEAQHYARQAGYDLVFMRPNGLVARVIELLALENVLLKGVS